MPLQSDSFSGNTISGKSAMKIRDIIKRIETDGWRMVRQAGSHRPAGLEN
jgi:transposase